MLVKKKLSLTSIGLIFLMLTACTTTLAGPGPDQDTATVNATVDSFAPDAKNRLSSVADDYGISHQNYPKIDGSTSTLSIVRAINKAMYRGAENDNYPQTAAKTVPSYHALIAGDVDLILVPMASSALLAQAANKGVELEFHPIAAEALVFITPKENSADKITLEQVRTIYLTDGITNWKEIGGPDRQLVPICRNADSGSQSQLDNMVLNGRRMHPAIEQNQVELTMEGMLEQVACYHGGGLNGKPTKCYALGYTLYTYLKSMGDITGIDEQLKMLAIDGVIPSAETIADGSYPLTDAYYAVIRKDLPLDHSARGIIRWLESSAGKDAIRQLNLIPKSHSLGK